MTKNDLLFAPILSLSITFSLIGIIGGYTLIFHYITSRYDEWKSKNFHDTLNTVIACRKSVHTNVDKTCGIIPTWSQFSEDKSK